MKSKITAIVCFFLLALSTLSLKAENQIFELRGYTVENHAPLADVKITVYEGSIFMTQFSTANNGTFIFSLEFNKNFKISVEKEGYAKEDIIVNTALPNDYPAQKISHEISLKMFVVSKENLPFTFEEAVARISFQPVLKKFISDVNYKKTFQTNIVDDATVHDRLGNSAVSQEFKYELSLRRNQTKKKEEAKPEETTTPAKKTVIEQMIVKEEIKKTALRTEKTLSETQGIAKKTAEEPKEIENKITKTVAEIDKSEVLAIKQKEEVVEVSESKAKVYKRYVPEKEVKKIIVPMPEKKKLKSGEKETIREITRVIDRLVVTKNGKDIEYTVVSYNNGGVYYFRNGFSISLETYQKDIKPSK